MPFLVLDKTCNQTLRWTEQELHDAGFRVVQTFDLQVARLAHPECAFPHHGEAQCNCQMVVLLVYRKQEDPATLIIHGQESKSSISMAVPVDRHNNQQLEIAIRHVLTSPLSNVQSPGEAAHEVRPSV